jgi:hypothetical protein
MTDSASRFTSISDPAFDELREAHDSRKRVIIAGAGVSAAASLLSWSQLVGLLSERTRARGVGASDFGTVIERHPDDRLMDEPE